MRFVCSLIAVLLFAGRAVAADFTGLEEFIRAQLAQQHAPGFVIGIADGDTNWIRAFGYADLENKTAMTPDASFRIASLTKSMTAVAVLQLAEAGKIDLDAEVQTYVPYFPRKPWPVTIRQLLGHVGGISHYKNRALEQHIKEHHTTRESVAIFENFDLVAEPGTKFSYSSYGYVLLGAVIEAASGQPYETYLREKIWKPLGMKDTRMDDPIAIIPKRVRGYQIKDGSAVNSEFIDVSSRFAAGGLRSTVPDMLRFARGLMSDRLITRRSRDLMFTSMTTRDGKLTDHGMGMFTLPIFPVLDTNGRFAVTNSGGQQETRTFLLLFPERNVVLMTAMNFELNDDDTLIQRVAQSVFGEPLDLAPTAADRSDAAMLTAMQRVFTLGLSAYEAHPQQAIGDIAPALAYFNSVIGANAKEAAAKLDAGREPVNGAPLTVLGRAMAVAIHASRDTATRGSIEFFRDAVRTGRFPFPAALTARLDRWAADWSAATPPSVRKLSITSISDVAMVAATLRRQLVGKSVVPDFARRLLSVTENVLATNTERASQAGSLAAELYPVSGQAQFALALVRIAHHDLDGAEQLMIRASELDPEERFYIDHANGVAYALANAGKLREGIALLRIATKRYPSDANLADSLRELTGRERN